MQAWNQYLDYLIDPSFQGVNKVFVLTYENIEQWTSYKWYFLPALKIITMLYRWKKFLWLPLKNDSATYDNIRKAETGQWDYITGCSLGYPYFE